MDVYVLTENGHVLGAGTDRSVSEDIADRRGDTWSEWIEESDGHWIRHRAVTSGWNRRDKQEIVRVQLAGMPELGGLARDWVDQVAKAVPYRVPAGQATVTYPWADGDLRADLRTVRGEELARLGYSDLLSTIERWKAAIRDAEMPTDGTIRAGTGAARQWVERAVDAMPGGSRPATTDLSMMAGLTIVLDASIPPDQIKIGPVTYVVGTPEGIVRPGQMVRIELPSDG